MKPDPRLMQAANIWLATVRPDARPHGVRPHLVPIWFVVANDQFYICTSPTSVKAQNLRANPCVTLALEDGSHPFVVEGQARPIAPTTELINQFKAKYDWDITTDSTYSQVFEITVTKQVMGA